MKINSKDSDMRYFYKVHVQCSKQLHELQNDLPFLPEKIKIGMLKKPVCNLYDKKNILHT